MRQLIFTFLLAAAIIPATALAQLDTVYVPGDIPPGQGNLNDSIQAAINTGRLSSTVFELQRDGRYILTGSVTTPVGSKLTIVAPDPGTIQATAPPQILWTTNTAAQRNFIFDCYGNVTLKNLWILYADTDGVQVSSAIDIEDDSTADLSGAGERATFDGVIFDYSQTPPSDGGCVTITAKDFNGTFENCYFRNDIDPRLRFYGRALSFPYAQSGYHSDSVSFENCTFANLGYVYQQEEGDYADCVSFNHCTFLNIMMYTLESGCWKDLAVTNCIFENAFMYGNIPASSGPNGGTIAIDSVSDFGFSVPFTDQQRHILFANNSYYTQPWLVDWMQNNPYSQNLHTTRQDTMIPVPQPMMNAQTLAFFDTTNSNGAKAFPYMNMAEVYDSVSPHFIAPPTNIDSIKQFLYEHWSADNSVNWAYEPQNDIKQLWPMEESLAYTNDTLLAAGMSGFPLGDLYHWFPAKYAAWKTQAASEQKKISYELLNGEMVYTPAAPRLVSPVNGSNGLTGSITLKWNKDSHATGYQVQVSLDPTFNNQGMLAVNDSSITDTNESIQVGLGTTYYWRVLAYDFWGRSAYSAADTFTTKLIAATEVPRLVSPPDGAANQIPPVTLACNRTSDASEFHWQVRTDTLFSSGSGFVVNDSTFDTTNVVTSLKIGTKYYWRVQGVDPVGASAFSAADSFSVMAVPGAPVLASPGQNATSVRSDTLALEWHPVPLDSGYVCQLWTITKSDTSMLQDSTKDTTVTFTNLRNLVRYYWHVAAFNPVGEGEYSTVDSFTTITAKPSPPIVVSPDGVTGEPRMTTFSWKPSALAAKYELQVATDSVFASIVVDTAVTDTTVLISDTLSQKEVYFWRVGAINAAGEGLFSGTAQFTTGSGVLGVEQAPGVPKNYALLQNYPNPFNPTTTIEFSLPRSGLVSLDVYDVLGREVATLVNKKESAGRYSVQFDASRLASGVYFCRLVAGGHVFTKKMLFVK